MLSIILSIITLCLMVSVQKMRRTAKAPVWSRFMQYWNQYATMMVYRLQVQQSYESMQELSARKPREFAPAKLIEVFNEWCWRRVLCSSCSLSKIMTNWKEVLSVFLKGKYQEHHRFALPQSALNKGTESARCMEVRKSLTTMKTEWWWARTSTGYASPKRVVYTKLQSRKRKLIFLKVVKLKIFFIWSWRRWFRYIPKARFP